ncbi:MAG: DUF1549 domain-containing protein [Planctomycetaceae bacterium]
MSHALSSVRKPHLNSVAALTWNRNLFGVVIVCAALCSTLGGPVMPADAADIATAGGTAVVATAPEWLPKFELDIQPMLTSSGCNMGACHGKARGQNGFALSLLGFDSDFDYHAIVNAGRGRRVFPAAPERSLLLLKASAEVPHGGGVRWKSDGPEYRLLLDWIRAGMPRVTESDPRLERIAISPEPHPMAVRSEESLQVTAYYSDGSQRNVTATSAYQSNEPAVVAVDRDGKLRAGSLPGEATVMARYMGHISTWSTAIPRGDVPPTSAYDSLPRDNFIDDLVWKKLRELNILPSDPIDDAKFIRRLHLDLIGRLPTKDEVRDFLQDSNPDKRDVLIDALLERPEYADHWANKWADLVRPNPYRVGIKATLSLDHWLRDAFRQNLPYDEFARGLVTARGSTWHNGAVTIFRDRRTPEEITTMISQLFLGVRLDCARCHQHPFEVYGQKEFYSLAAYFARVGYKGTGLSPPISGGEEMVIVKDKGEVQHPLTNQVLPPKPLIGDYRDCSEGEDRRAVFADWMVSPENPYFARAGANRIWGELFGKGIVDPVDDLRATNPPSNPELLDALAAEFRRVDFDAKKLLKTIVQSHVYSLSSIPNETNAGDARNYSRHYRRLARAEVLADAIADITQQPDDYQGMPPGSRSIEVWTHRVDSDFLDAFGRPDENQDPPCERLPEANMVQALHLMNAPNLNRKLTADASIVTRLAKDEIALEAAIEEIYLTVYSRFPTDDERAALVADFSESKSPRRAFIEDLVWSLLNTPEFVYED